MAAAPDPQAHPVSVKAVLWTTAGRLVLLHNERDEWELPGGRVDPDDVSWESALARELEEELRATHVVVGEQVYDWLYQPLPGRVVHVVAFAATAVLPDQLWHSHEHDDVASFAPDDLAALSLPEGYREAIRRG